MDGGGGEGGCGKYVGLVEGEAGHDGNGGVGGETKVLAEDD